MTTGLCQENCLERADGDNSIPGLVDEVCHTCGRGCMKCEVPETQRCLSCKSSFYFQNDTKECLKLTETRNFLIILFSSILSFVLLVVIICGCIAYKMLTGKASLDELEAGNKLKKAAKKLKNHRLLFKKVIKNSRQEELALLIENRINKCFLKLGFEKIKLY